MFFLICIDIKFLGTFCNVYWIRTKCKQTWSSINKAILGKIGGVYLCEHFDLLHFLNYTHIITFVRYYPHFFSISLLHFFVSLLQKEFSSCGTKSELNWTLSVKFLGKTALHSSLVGHYSSLSLFTCLTSSLLLFLLTSLCQNKPYCICVWLNRNIDLGGMFSTVTNPPDLWTTGAWCIHS